MRGVWLSDEMVMGPLTFQGEASGRREASCYQSRCGVTPISDEGLQRLLDEARRRPAGSGRVG